MVKIHNAHDMLAKRFLTNVSVAKDFLKAHLPKDISSCCNFATLKIKATSYIEEDMRTHLADILYELEIDGRIGFIYVLLEAQSNAIKLMPLRYVRYTTSIWKNYAENNPGKGLPVIIPLLLYTGKKSPYPYSLAFADCFEDPDFAKKVLNQQVHLIDLSMTSDDEIKNHGQAALLEMVQKHIYDRDVLNLAHEIVEILRFQEVSRDLFTDLLQYIISEGDSLDYKGFFNILIEQSSQHKEATMNIAERLKQDSFQQGIHVGIEQGKSEGEHEKAISIAKNMLLKHADIHFIKEVTGLSDVELSKIIQSH